jgi:hypothetical protein
MWKFFVSVYKTICDFFERFFVVITLIIGSFCLYYGITNDLGNPDIKKLLHTIGSISLASGIFAGIAKSNQFTEIYKKILRDIVYGKEHLEVRKDLEKIWENVTESLINQRFAKINDKMKGNIKKYFLPMNHDYYYNNFNVDITIEKSTIHPDYVVIKETTSYTIECEDEDLVIDNKFITGIKIDLANKNLTTYELKKLFIDGIEKKEIGIVKKIEGNILMIEYKSPLKDKKTYNIKRIEEKHYNIKFNSIRRHIAVWLYNNCTIDITYPLDIHIDFYNMGVLNEFKIDDKSTASYNRIKADYNGLIYKNQGFFLHLRKK